MKPSGAKVLDKAVHKSGSLYACLINRVTIKLKTRFIISNQVRNNDCFRFVLASFQDRLLLRIGSFSFVIKLACSRRRSDSENTRADKGRAVKRARRAKRCDAVDCDYV